MKRKYRLTMAGVGLLGIAAVPVAVVACGESGITISAQEYQYLGTTNAQAFGSERLEASLLDLVSGKSLTFNRTDGSNLGIRVPVLPAGVSVRLQKTTGTAITFTVSQGSSTKSATATVAAFGVSRDAEDADQAASSLAAINSTTDSQSGFTARTVAAGTVLDAALATALGIRAPTLPAGVTATASKAAGSAVLNFAISKGAVSRSATATVANFAVNRDAEDVDGAVAALGRLVTTVLARGAFTGKTIPAGTILTAGAAEALGTRTPSVPEGVAVTVQKLSGASVEYSVTKGAITRTASVEVTGFGADRDAEDVNDAASLLGAIANTTLDQASFTALTIASGTQLNAALPTVSKVVKNYLFFLGTTACPYCNASLTGSQTRSNYTDPTDINSYTGSFVAASLRLKSNAVVDEVFI